VIRLRVLGTSAAMPSAERSHVGFVVQAGGSYLVECGPTIPWQLERAGIDHRSIGDVLVSHVHVDHSLGLPLLFTSGELDGRSWPLRVYCPESAVERLKTIGRSCYPSQARLIEERVEWVGLPEGAPAERELPGGAYLRSAPGKHGVPDLAYRIEYGGRSMVYSGDTAPAQAVVDLAQGADLLLHDATWSEVIDGRSSEDHSSCRQAGQIAAAAGVGRLGLVHLHKQYRGREAELRAEAAEAFGGEVLIPDDGDDLEI
jgi:ribonuclease Z